MERKMRGPFSHQVRKPKSSSSSSSSYQRLAVPPAIPLAPSSSTPYEPLPGESSSAPLAEQKSPADVVYPAEAMRDPDIVQALLLRNLDGAYFQLTEDGQPIFMTVGAIQAVQNASDEYLQQYAVENGPRLVYTSGAVDALTEALTEYLENVAAGTEREYLQQHTAARSAAQPTKRRAAPGAGVITAADRRRAKEMDAKIMRGFKLSGAIQALTDSAQEYLDHVAAGTVNEYLAQRTAPSSSAQPTPQPKKRRAAPGAGVITAADRRRAKEMTAKLARGFTAYYALHPEEDPRNKL